MKAQIQTQKERLVSPQERLALNILKKAAATEEEARQKEKQLYQEYASMVRKFHFPYKVIADHLLETKGWEPYTTQKKVEIDQLLECLQKGKDPGWPKIIKLS